MKVPVFRIIDKEIPLTTQEIADLHTKNILPSIANDEQAIRKSNTYFSQRSKTLP